MAIGGLPRDKAARPGCATTVAAGGANSRGLVVPMRSGCSTAPWSTGSRRSAARACSSSTWRSPLLLTQEMQGTRGSGCSSRELIEPRGRPDHEPVRTSPLPARALLRARSVRDRRAWCRPSVNCFPCCCATSSLGPLPARSSTAPLARALRGRVPRVSLPTPPPPPGDHGRFPLP
jgi:hypothetical protein